MISDPASEPSGTAITVFLADDNVNVREGVRAMLDRYADVEIVVGCR